jgi:Tfp pilus assembly protein PilF
MSHRRRVVAFAARLVVATGALQIPAGLAQEGNDAGRNILLAIKNQVEAARAAPLETWSPAAVGLELAIHDRLRTGDLSQASVRLTNLSVLQIDELTTIEILAPKTPVAGKAGLDVHAGRIYFFSRDKPREIELQTPVATGALRGTEFHLLVGPNGRTVLTMFDGEIELRNAFGSVVVRTGEEGLVEPGQAPTKTAVILSNNIIQWCLYYPGLLDVDKLHLDSALNRSRAAYRDGDLLQALKLYPRGRQPHGADEQAYLASLLLAVGQVSKAEALLSRSGPKADALQRLIAAVKFQERKQHLPPRSAVDWLAESYYRQSRSDLSGALLAAQTAADLAPDFGFAWVRVAEIQFGFRHIPQAARALQRGRAISPRNAQAAALAGYFASARNNVRAAAQEFDQALAIDGFLGNAWLGRGLCKIRRGMAEEGREDLQTAAAMEPNRALLHSYTGKAFSNAGDDVTAVRELNRSRVIDPNDPTSWLYSALVDKQDHKFNQAIDDLAESLRLNDNRRVYRSTFLLDEDRAVRNANLAAIYQDNGLNELSLRVASRAVTDDYANASAHLFLANSYNALRDPRRILLRYDTAFFNELLLANLLSPVGGGPLSQNVSDQEYSKLFESDRLGFSSNTTYLSTGQVRELGSQYGQWGNLAYSVDVNYESDRGLRPNNHLDRLEIYSQAKYQLGLQDSIFIQTKYQDNRNGDVFQYYDQNQANRSFAYRETQEPLAFVGYHHEWAPGLHTLVLVSRLDSEQTEYADQIALPLLSLLRNQPIDLSSVAFRLRYLNRFTIYAGELNQTWQTETNTLVLGIRAQAGDFSTSATFDKAKSLGQSFDFLFNALPIRQSEQTDYRRFEGYCYETLKPIQSLALTVGFSYDDLLYPTNYRNPPLLGDETNTTRFSPKVGLVWKPWNDGVVRAAYTASLGGVTVEDSVRLEPTLVGGFNQALRTLVPESVTGTVNASRDSRFNLGFEQKLGSATYLAVEANTLSADVNRFIGLFSAERDPQFPANLPVYLPGSGAPRSTEQRLRYGENNLLVTANQLLADDWSIGAIYRVSRADLDTALPSLLRSAPAAFRPSLSSQSSTSETGILQEGRWFVLYNHPSGFFARAEALWIGQDNQGYPAKSTVAVSPSGNPNGAGKSKIIHLHSPNEGADFWQFNLYAGWRLPRNAGDITLGLLDLTGQDYRLNPLNEYLELPRSVTVSVQTRLNF